MKKLFVGLLALVWACGGETVVPNEPPLVIGTLSDQELYIDEGVIMDLDSVFADPEMDTLTYGVSHAEDVVSSTLNSRAELAISAVSQGSAIVTVAASDSAGNTAELDFRVTVLNRDPQLLSSIGNKFLYVDSTTVLYLNEHFLDPDFDRLMYEVVSNSTDLEVETSGDELTMSALGAGGAQVEITVSDGHGGELKHDFSVSMANAPVSVFRDDFDRDSIGEDWTETGFDGDALLVEERLRINVNRWSFAMITAADVEKDWLVETNVIAPDKICAQVFIRVHSKNIKQWLMTLNGESGRWDFYLQVPNNNWYPVNYGSSSFTWGEYSTVSVGMVDGTRLVVTVDGEREAVFNPAHSSGWPGGSVPDEVYGIALGGRDCMGSEGGVEFDWVEVYGAEG